MRVAIDVSVDPWELAKTLDHDEAKEFIMAIDETMATCEFTIDLMKSLASAMEKEGEENEEAFKQIGALLRAMK